ncbi:bacterial-type extracellular deoxyribonuclease [Ophiocordyceps camponoti-floridani]|uniref:Bacterial-type extracellular deoxyribonuclease n=1 Tax=Ophiocordyceps camponoti-floridani TaxID=2030778 RepID=A0A8H4Q598_9HYPO|nr:bacterial-type extracellular deoxyribonuclease [Ophiocordyceps camponoti-floridani]
MKQPGIPSPPTARTLLSKLRVSPSEPGTGYSRAKFPHWETIDDGCNVRTRVLRRDGRGVVVDDDCHVSGRWTSPYDGETVDDASEIDIDHLVPLKNAWISGASHWETSRRRTLANDLSSPQLWAVTAQANREKGDGSPDEWLPSVEGFRCVYAESWVRVKDKYGLTVTREEREALEGVLGAC